MGCRFFKRVFRLHVELGGHLIAVVAVEVVVKRFVVAAYAAAYACGMGGEYRSYLRYRRFQGEKTHSRGPFVEMSHYVAAVDAVMAADALDH